MRIHTVGHGTLPAIQLTDLLQTAGLARVVDVRSHPGSRHNPQYNREALETWLPEGGLEYSW